MNKERKLSDIIFKFSDRDTYETAFKNINSCLAKEVCIEDKCNRYHYCAGNNLTHIDLYVEKLELIIKNQQEKLDKINEYIDKELKDMPINGCRYRLKNIQRMINK